MGKREKAKKVTVKAGTAAKNDDSKQKEKGVAKV